MAHLRDPHGRLVLLDAAHLVGRSRAANTVLGSADVSGQHLAINWTGQDWRVRDLASRNGTWVDGRRLDGGEMVPLRPGMVVWVGGPTLAYTVADLAPPSAYAVDGETVIEGEPDLLALPSVDDPLVLFQRDPGQGWLMSTGASAHGVHTGEIVEVGGRSWRVTLPDALTPTIDARTAPPMTEALGLRFRVSGDEEYVELTAVLGGVPRRLPARAHHEILLTLARSRIEDAELPEGDRGWVYTSELMKMVHLSSNQLYVGLHRARRELGGLGVDDPDRLIERRTTTHQVRIGVGELVIETF